MAYYGRESSDWQISFEKTNDRLRHIWRSKQLEDCSFIVGSKHNQFLVRAHKLILAIASPVFEAMLYRPMAGKTDKAIPLTDVRPEVFSALLEYIYTDNINIDSFDIACELYYSADKYMLNYLKNECLTYISKNISAKNACRAYEFAKLFDIRSLMESCVKYKYRGLEALAETTQVLSARSFIEANISTIITVYDQEQLNIKSEVELFNALEKYSEANNIRVAQQPLSAGNDKQLKLEITGSPDSSPTIRDAIKKIRFLTMTPKKFVEGPSKSNLF